MAIGKTLKMGFWVRHTNPLSGYTWLPLRPVLLFALYQRGRMIGATIIFTVINPVLFSESDSTYAWISRSVLGRERWLDDGHGIFETNITGVLNILNAISYCYGHYGVYKRNSRITAVGGALAVTFKMSCLRKMVNYYDERSIELGGTA